MAERGIGEIRYDVLDTKCWLKKVIASVESDEQLDAAQRMVQNWSSLMCGKIHHIKPAFFRPSKEWGGLVESYMKSRKELESHLAAKKAKLRFIKRDELHA